MAAFGKYGFSKIRDALTIGRKSAKRAPRKPWQTLTRRVRPTQNERPSHVLAAESWSTLFPPMYRCVCGQNSDSFAEFSEHLDDMEDRA